MQEKVILIIPAYNEETGIKTPLRHALSLRDNGVISEVLVVDDGSTDRTAEIARKAGATVLSLEKNIGKGGAVLKAALYCKKAGADIIVLLDADLISAMNNSVVAMLDKLHSNDESEKPFMMATAPAVEGNAHPTSLLSGERAIKMAALNFLFVQKGGEWAFSDSYPARWFWEMSTGYGLVLALGYKIKDSVRLSESEALFKLESACRKDMEAQMRQLRATANIIEWRMNQAELLRRERHGTVKQKKAFVAVKKQQKLAVAV